MKISIRKKIQKIIDKKYLTDWEFITDVIAPEIYEEDFDVDEISKMVSDEKELRHRKLWEK